MSNTNNAQTYNSTEQQFLPTVSIDGLGNLGNYDKFSGGDAKASVTKHRPGGMGPQVSYLSLPEYSTITVSRVYDEGRDHALIGTLRTLVGAVYGTVSVQPLDQNAAPFGTPTTYRGRLSSVNAGNADSTSSTPRMYDLEFECETEAN
jgi:hypothetical protein